YADGIAIGLYSVIIILWIWGFILQQQVKSFEKMDLEGEEEDEVAEISYRKFSDYSFIIQSNSVLSLLALCIVLVTTMNTILIIIGMVFSLVGYFLMASMIRLMQIVYPERNLPSASESDYSKKFLDSVDDGEKYVMLHGLYRSYNLVNILLMFGMI